MAKPLSKIKNPSLTDNNGRPKFPEPPSVSFNLTEYAEHGDKVKIADVEMDEDSDPIKASYDVYIKPHISSDRQIYILQFPNRDSKQHYSAANHSQPLELRIKPEAGMLELDVPIDAWRNYDREKGVRWGEAMRRSNMSKGGGSHGLPGGFGIGGSQPSSRSRGRGEGDDEVNQEAILEDYAGAIQREQVLSKQTLGGQSAPNEETTPQYMIGVFRKSRASFQSRFEMHLLISLTQISFILPQSITLSKCGLSFTTSMPYPSKNVLVDLEIQALSQHVSQKHEPSI